MSHKENNGMGTTTSNVKDEPEEPKILQASFSLNRIGSMKSEKNDTACISDLPGASYAVASGSTATSADVDFEMENLPESNTLYTEYTDIEQIAYTPENAFKAALGMVQAIQKGVSTVKLGSKLREEVWGRELESLSSETTPKLLIALCGATGAGKSSAMNALLDDNIVPTSGMRACTATVTSISYHEKKSIDASIEFLTENEWAAELRLLKGDLVDDDGNIKRATDMKSDAGVAWAKVHAVYPKLTHDDLVKMTAEEIIAQDPNIAKFLSGKPVSISAKNSESFAKEIAKYIDSKDRKKKKKSDSEEQPKEKGAGQSLMDKVRAAAGGGKKVEKKKKADDTEAPALWPLIKVVKIKCNSATLSTGAVLVDLPGTADSNAARSSIAKAYMKQCQCIWICSNITRAVDDKAARDLLGEAFKVQLLMDGSYDAHTITFVATKTDDISASEVISALGLGDDETLEELQDELDAAASSTKEQKKVKAAEERTIKQLDKDIKGLRAQIEDHEEHLEALRNDEPFVSKLAKKKKTETKKRKNKRSGRTGSSKRQRSSPVDSDTEDHDEDEIDSDDSDDAESNKSDESGDESDDGGSQTGDEDEEEEEEEEVTPQSLKAKIADLKSTLKDVRANKAEAQTKKKEASEALASLRKTTEKLQRAKNGYCAMKRSEFSKEVLREDFRTGLKTLDDSASEERDPDNFNPATDIRDYEAINLPVHCVSARDYVRLKGQIKSDGPPSCFTDVEDTGVPQLQKWVHELTQASRGRSAKQLLARLQTFSQSVTSALTGINGVTPQDRNTLRDRWESKTADAAAAEPVDEWEGFDWKGILERGASLYTMKSEDKVDAYGILRGISPELAKAFTEIVDSRTEEIKTIFRSGLEDKCREGALKAADNALAVSDDFQTMHWSTYRATLRRHGSWRRNLNVELVAPLTRHIASTWSGLFSQNLFAALETSIVKAINKLVEEVQDTAAIGLKDRVRQQGELCLQEATVSLKASMDLVRDRLTEQQKDISRSLAPHVETSLTDSYDLAMQERGPGSVARQKAVFTRELKEVKDTMFDDGSEVVLLKLDEAVSCVASTLDKNLGLLAQKVEVNLAVLWEEGAVDDPVQAKARQRLLEETKKVQAQTTLWTAAALASEAAASFITFDEDVVMT
ncbi:hypothetical protein C8J56DRAFT_934806 [Mycena floridula]|nr:hypothetical protein C8J56DRAFT_934806 [Mycena floridula]